MVVFPEWSRRCVVRSLASSTLLVSLPRQEIMSLEQARDVICASTPAVFRSAVRETGNLLYRGEDTGLAILSPKPDLLLPGTYNEEEALAYFQCLERTLLSVRARPSTGHIGTTVRRDAAMWGSTVVSVWPLGDELSWVWPRSSALFYPDGPTNRDGFVVDEGLAEALRSEKEILFCSLPQTPFLAVPSDLDNNLLNLLQVSDYGLSWNTAYPL